jgi:hypothetical protein
VFVYLPITDTNHSALTSKSNTICIISKHITNDVCLTNYSIYSRLCYSGTFGRVPMEYSTGSIYFDRVIIGSYTENIVKYYECLL